MTFEYKKIYHKKYKYELIQSCEVFTKFMPHKDIITDFYSFSTIFFRECEPVAWLSIKEGYRWDGASGPTIDTESTMRASCVHDALYQMIRNKELPYSDKYNADKELRILMREDCQSKTFIGKLWNKFRSGYYYYGVKLFGGRHCKPI